MSTAQPFNSEAERTRLCAILREPDCLEKAASIIEPEDLSQAHGIIFRTALNLFEADGVVDPGTVVAALSAAGELECFWIPLRSLLK